MERTKNELAYKFDLLRYSETLTVIIVQKDITRTVEVHFFLNTGFTMKSLIQEL